METTVCRASMEEKVKSAKLEFVVKKHSNSFGRKRILISRVDELIPSTDSESNLKKRRNEGVSDFDISPQGTSQSPLESLPLDIVVKIICRADEDDLNQLYRVSKFIRGAAEIAKETYFKYKTPKKFRVFTAEFDESMQEYAEFEAPNAPKRRLSFPQKRDLSDVCIALFTSPLKRGNLFMDSDED